MNWTAKPGKEPVDPKPNRQKNPIWGRLENRLQEKTQQLILDYINGALNPIVLFMMEWTLRRNSAARRRVTTMRYLMEVTCKQPLQHPSHAVLKRIQSKVQFHPKAQLERKPMANSVDRFLQIGFAILTLLNIWSRSG